MATVVFCSWYGYRRRAALMAMRDNLIRDSFAHSFIKYEVLPIKRTEAPARALDGRIQ